MDINRNIIKYWANLFESSEASDDLPTPNLPKESADHGTADTGISDLIDTPYNRKNFLTKLKYQLVPRTTKDKFYVIYNVDLGLYKSFTDGYTEIERAERFYELKEARDNLSEEPDKEHCIIIYIEKESRYSFGSAYTEDGSINAH